PPPTAPLEVWRSSDSTDLPAPVPSPAVTPPTLPVPGRRRLGLGEPLASLPSRPTPSRAPVTPPPSPAPRLQRLAVRPPAAPRDAVAPPPPAPAVAHAPTVDGPEQEPAREPRVEFPATPPPSPEAGTLPLVGERPVQLRSAAG